VTVTDRLSDDWLCGLGSFGIELTHWFILLKISCWLHNSLFKLLIKSTLHCHLDQMLHENIQAYIFSEEVAWFYRGVLVAQTARVDSYFNLSFICVTRCAHEESWHWESLSHYILCVFDGDFQERLQVSIVGLLVITCFLPVSNFLTLPDADIKKGV